MIISVGYFFSLFQDGCCLWSRWKDFINNGADEVLSESKFAFSHCRRDGKRDLFCKANTKEYTERKANLYHVFVGLLNTFHTANRNTL